MSLSLSLRYRYLLVLGLLAAATWLAYLSLDRPDLGIDDAYIFFVYAQNINDGQGIVYNPGGERVEGFSSPLWLAVVTAVFAIFPDPLPILLLITLLLLSLGLSLLWRWLDGSDRLTLRGFLFIAWVCSSPAFIIWTTLTLMDTALWSALLVVGCWLLLARPAAVYVNGLVALLILARPEGMAWSAVFVLLWGVVHLPERSANAQRKIIQPAITYGVTLLALLSGRLLYFGYPLPNTYYAKMSPHLIYNLQQGSLYLRDFLAANAHLWLVTWLPVLWLALAKGWPFPTPLSEERARSLSVVAVVVWGLAVPVLTGGDHFYLHRFYQPLWPLLILPLLLVMDDVKRPFPPALHYAVALSLILIFCFGAQTNWWQRQKLAAVGFEFTLQENGRLIGHSLNAMFPGDKPTIGVMAAGGIAFAYEGEVVDVLGLNNVRVAHMPGDRYGLKNHSAFNSDIFLQQRPALFLPEVAAPEATMTQLCEAFGAWSVADMLTRPLFWQLYQRVLLVRGDGRIVTYADKEYLRHLPPDITVEVLSCALP